TALAAYDVISHDVDVTYSPERQWINGRSTMRLKVGALATSQITIRLADALTVQSIISSQFGRLFGIRAKGLNAVLINLPAILIPGTDLTLTLSYFGHVPPDAADRETAGAAALQDTSDEL